MTATATVPRGKPKPPPLEVLERDREPAAGATGAILQVPLELIDVDANIRASVESIDELAASIAEHGVRQPISLRDVAGDRYAINFGQRRFLASKLAGRPTIPAFIDNEARTPEQLAIHQLVENLARADLPPLDRARAMRTVVDAGMTQAELARQLGLAASTVTNDLRLLTLDPEVQARIEAGEISPSHGKAIASLPPKHQREIAERVVKQKWSSHQLEREIEWRQADANRDQEKAAKTAKWIPKAIAALEAAKVGPGTLVSIRGDTWSMDSDAVLAAVRKAGWKADREYRYGRPKACDCDAIVLEVGGRKAEIKPVCVDRRHEDQQRNSDRTADDARRAEQAKRLKVLRKHLRAALEDLPLPVLLLAHGDTWQLPGLVKNAPGLTRNATLETVMEAMLRRVDASTVWNDRQKEIAGALESLIAMFEQPTAQAEAPAA